MHAAWDRTVKPEEALPMKAPRGCNQSALNKGRLVSSKFKLLSVCSLVFDMKLSTSKSATFFNSNLLCGGYPCCKRSSYAGEQIENNRQTNRLTYYTRGRPCASGNKHTDRQSNILLYPLPPTLLFHVPSPRYQEGACLMHYSSQHASIYTLLLLLAAWPASMLIYILYIPCMYWFVNNRGLALQCFSCHGSA